MAPISSDPARQKYLDLRALCNQAFTPFAPIELPEFFAGRIEIIDRISQELEAPGRHVAIYGERGVGKTSLATLLSFFTSFSPERVRIVRCDADSTFETIFTEFLERFGLDLAVDRVERESAARLAFGSLGSGERRRREQLRRPRQSLEIGKARVLHAFEEAESLLIVDEYDRVTDSTTHRRLAELVKAFSDSRSSSKLVIVGVAENLDQLIGEHPSLSRSLAQIGLPRMTREELEDILTRGEARTGIRFDRTVRHRIVSLADGFPQYVHLISLHAALAAVDSWLDRPQNEPHVGEKEYRLGVARAIENSEHSLVQAYQEAIVTTRRRSDIYELILQAIAMAEGSVVQVREIARYASLLKGEEVKPASLSNALGRLIREDKGRVLTKVRDGYYKLTNPLLSAYVRLLLDQRFHGQLDLPFFAPP